MTAADSSSRTETTAAEPGACGLSNMLAFHGTHRNVGHSFAVTRLSDDGDSHERKGNGSRSNDSNKFKHLDYSELAMFRVNIAC